MKTDEKIKELIADCDLFTRSATTSPTDEARIAHGVAPLLAESAEQLMAQRNEARTFADKMYSECLSLHIVLAQVRDAIGATKDWNNAEWSTLPGLVKKALEKSVPEYTKLAQANAALEKRNEKLAHDVDVSDVLIVDLKAQLTVAERISNDRNEARVAGLSEIAQLRNDLANAKKIADGYSKQAFELMSEKSDLAARLSSAGSERDSLRMKLETQTKIELPTKSELINVIFSSRVGDTVADKAQRVFDLLQRSGAVSSAGAVKIELPSIEEMHEQFDKGFEEAISETRGSNVYASDANGLRRVRDLIAARLGLTDQKPTNTETVAPVEVSEPAPTLWDRFKKATGRTRQITDERPLYFSDLKALCELLDR